MKTFQKSWHLFFLMILVTIIGIRCGNDDEVKVEGPVKDVDGNEYETVIIGDQVWMAENLKVIRLNDGTSIPKVTDNTPWSTMESPGLCWYDNDETQNKDVYGALYNWHTVATGKLCPSGWHIPSAGEWEILNDYLGDSAASKLKEVGNAHWATQNKDATNSTGFTSRPGGYRVPNSGFQQKGYYGYWWSSTSDPNNTARVFGREMNAQSKDGSEVVYNPNHGMSVRCLKN
jgi:uncharacterized protein (TIGR02145 family)